MSETDRTEKDGLWSQTKPELRLCNPATQRRVQSGKVTVICEFFVCMTEINVTGQCTYVYV